MDCERVRNGLLDQPVNALSSVAYLVAGAALLVQRRGRSSCLVAFAVAVAGNGLGGLAYHGVGGTWSRVFHDVALYTTVALLILRLPLQIRRPFASRRRVWWPLIATMSIALPIYLTSRTGGPLCAPDSVLQGHAVWHVLTALALFWCGRLVALDAPQAAVRRP